MRSIAGRVVALAPSLVGVDAGAGARDGAGIEQRAGTGAGQSAARPVQQRELQEPV